MDPNTRQQRPKIKRKIENPADVAERSNISSLSRLIAANPITSTPARDASVARTKRTMDSLQGVQANLASPTFGMDTLNRAGNSANTPSMMALGTAPLAVPGQAAGAMQYVANPRSAAGALGSTDQYNITTRRGASTPGPAMGNQGAISAAYAARNANHVMPSVPQSDRVAQGMSTDRLFPSPGDAENKAKFEGIKLGRAAQKDKARDMRMQRAQWRGAIGYNSPAMGGGYAGRRSPIFDSEGNIDQMATIAASQMASNPQLSAKATQANRELGQGDRRLSQLATQEANRDALAQQRFGLDETLGNAKITDMAEGRRISELGLTNQFTLGQGALDLQGDQFDANTQNQFAQQGIEQRRIAELEAQGAFQRSEPYMQQQRTLQGLGDSAVSPAESFASFQGYQSQPESIKSLGADWAANEIRKDPSRAAEIVGELGISPAQSVDAYINAFKSPNKVVEDDVDGTMQKQKIEDTGLLLDALNVARPEGQKRKLPWLQEFLGFSYANPEYSGRSLSDLRGRAIQ